jgi:protein-S-isoprenylcysteine O-methyltransferase Ste14
MLRMMFFVYGVACHLVFLGVYACMAAFVGNFGFGALPTIDGPPSGSTAAAVVIDVALIAAFALQHSLMARPGFKAWWTRFVPAPIERSTYVLASSLVLVAMYAWWQPIPAPVWEATGPIARGALTALFFGGVGLVLYSTFLIDHFDLFGLRQVVLYFRKRSYSERHFVMPVLYRFIRHPLYVGWFITFWATPSMSAGHFLFALGMSVYILMAIPLEERDLEALHGESYRRWRDGTPAFVPRVGGSRPQPAPARTAAT